MSWFPRPAAPRALWADLRAFAAQRSPYQWGGMAIAIVMPLLIVSGFLYDSNHNVQPGPQVIYVQSWPANRTDAQIIADQKRDQAQGEGAKRERQRQFRKLDDEMKRYGI